MQATDLPVVVEHPGHPPTGFTSLTRVLLPPAPVEQQHEQRVEATKLASATKLLRDEIEPSESLIEIGSHAR